MSESRAVPAPWAERPDMLPLRALARPLSEPAAEISAILLMWPLFLVLAVWNGYPFLFFDSGAYVLEGFAHFFVPERSAVYSFFLREIGGRTSLWYVVFTQCLATAFVITEFARTLRPRTSVQSLLVIAAALTLFSSIAWFAAQIEPDCLTPLLVLSLYLVAFRMRQLGPVRTVLLIGLAGFATGAHPSHLGLCAGLVIAIGALRIATAWNPRLPVPQVLAPAMAFLLGLTLVLSANYALTKDVFVSRSGTVFLLARLMGDGVAKPTLDRLCPQQHLRLCAFKDRLPASADEWLWGAKSPFNALGRFHGTEAESGIVVAAALKQYPLWSLGTGFWESFRQFWMFRTGDGFSPQQWVLDPMFRSFMPHQLATYLDARQQRGMLRFPEINVVHYPLALISLFWVLFALHGAAKRRNWHRAALPAFILLALIGNALVCGMFSGPHDRYQSRLIWVAGLAMLLTEAPRGGVALRRRVESGT